MASKEKMRQQRKARAKRQTELRHWLVDEGVWMVAQERIYELFTDRSDVLVEYDRTEGSTDWVWLEEGLSAALSDMPNYQEANEIERDAMYTAAFILAYNTIRTRYPHVRPPTWILGDMALVAGTKSVPKDTASVVRDFLLEGRDAEALAALSELREGPYILWRSDFFSTDTFGPRKIIPTLPENTSYLAASTNRSLAEDGLMLDEAVFEALHYFAATGDMAIVRCNVIERSSPWDGVVVFAISNNEGDIIDLQEQGDARLR